MIDVTTPYKISDCDGASYDFTFDFKIIATDDLVVYLYDTVNKTYSTLAETDDYEVSTTSGNYNDGGTVRTVKDVGDGPEAYAYSSDYQIGIFQKRPAKQETDYINGGTITNQTQENTADHLVLLAQNIKELAERCIRITPFDDRTESLELPLLSQRAGNYLAFNADGKPIAAAGSTPDSVPVTDFMETVLDDENAPEVLVTLGFTADVSELNKLDGLSFTLTDLDSLTATMAELNKASDESARVKAMGDADYTVLDDDGYAVIRTSTKNIVVSGTADTDRADELCDETDTPAGFANIEVGDVAYNSTDDFRTTVDDITNIADGRVGVANDYFPDGDESYVVYEKRTLTLPTAADNTNRVLHIYKDDTGYGILTIDGEGTEKIVACGIEQTTLDLEMPNTGVVLFCDGTKWIVVSTVGCELWDIGGTIEAVYTKYLTGTTDADSETQVTHGISDFTKILSVITQIKEEANKYRVPASEISDSIHWVAELKSTYLRLFSVSAPFQGDEYKVVIQYYI